MTTTSPAMAEKSDPLALPSVSPANSEFASAHAQLLLIGEAIRTTVAELAIPPPTGSTPAPQPPHARTSQHDKVSTAAVSTPSIPPSHNGSLLPNATTSAAASEAAVPVVKTVLVTATERLAALHDHLRRVQSLMKEYETVSQRAVEMHHLPTTAIEKDKAGGCSGRRGSPAAKQKAVLTAAPEPPSPTWREGPSSGRPNGAKTSISSGKQSGATVPAAKGNVNAFSEFHDEDDDDDTACGPSLHQRRALASDAAFTRFCGLRVSPEHLLLPWSVHSTSAAGASAFVPPGVTAATAGFRPAQDKEEVAINALTALPFSPSSTASLSGTGSGHSQVSTSLRLAQQQRQQVAAAAHLPAYSRFFLNPQSPFKLAPVFTEGTSASAVEAYLSSPAASAEPVNGPSVLLRQLRDIQSQFEELRLCRLFSYEDRVRERKAAAAAADKGGEATKATTTTVHHGVSASSSGSGTASPTPAKQAAAPPLEGPKWKHTAVLVEHMCEVLTALRTRFVVESHYAHCGAPAVTLGRQLHAWTQPLLRQLSEMLSNPSLEDVDQDLREKLRRMKFDVEELQQEQADAIANGDMQRSEEIYYEQTALSEAMKTPYDEMEQLLEEYLEECVTTPLAALQEQKNVLVSQLTRVIEEHASRLTEVAQDAERVKEKRRSIIQARHRQRNAMSAYQHSWKKQWQGNSEEQMACYHAMEQLEHRLSNLQKAQSVLAEDWLVHMALERQREEDAAAFMCFAEARAQALTESQRNLQAVVDGLRQLSGAVHFGCAHAEAFAHDVLRSHVQDSQLALRKDRLAQFRALYLTLGDWRFKKSRNVEEIQKKIDYYTLQQELAMDVSNPKAKEYSQAKQQWEAAKAEALTQLDQLDGRSRLQLEAFQPTERLLRDAGVDFVSPEEELAQRNLQRTQRLAEYQQLIEEGIGVRGSGSRSAGGGLGNTTTTQRLPALMPGAATAAQTTQVRPFTADLHKSAAPPTSVRAKEGTACTIKTAPRVDGQPPTMTASAATAAAAVSPCEDDGRCSSGGAASTLPPIASSKSPTPPRFHSTEERIMRDISKAAGAGNGLASDKGQKRKLREEPVGLGEGSRSS
jgi:hypothetical protein